MVISLGEYIDEAGVRYYFDPVSDRPEGLSDTASM